MVRAITELLVKFGLTQSVSKTLAIRIDRLYRDERSKSLSEYGRKGGQAKVLKGIAKLKVSDPKKYKEVMAARSKKK